MMLSIPSALSNWYAQTSGNWKKSKDELVGRRTNTSPALSPWTPPLPKKWKRRNATLIIGKLQGKACASPLIWQFETKPWTVQIPLNKHTSSLHYTRQGHASILYDFCFLQKESTLAAEVKTHAQLQTEISNAKESSQCKIKSQKNQRNLLWE